MGFSKACIIALVGVLGVTNAEMNHMKMGLRASEPNAVAEVSDGSIVHLDLEVMVDGERQLFPLLPGVQCPTGHTCRSRTIRQGQAIAPMIGAMKNNMKTPLAMAKAAGLAAGVAVATVSQPAYAAETKEVKMGS